MSFLILFIAYILPSDFFYTKNTFPKLPLPITFLTLKSSKHTSIPF